MIYIMINCELIWLEGICEGMTALTPFRVMFISDLSAKLIQGMSHLLNKKSN